MNCWTVSAYFIEPGRLFQSLGAAIENALSPYVVVNDLGTINSLLVAERKARFGWSFILHSYAESQTVKTNIWLDLLSLLISVFSVLN